jgi:hypothetical protein
MMHLISLLHPATPAKPVGARVVRLLGDTPMSEEERRKARTAKGNKWRSKNRDRVRSYDRARYANSRQP